ncbi:MAG: T9SS type A sorting domain-containing protein [Bacteroidia bacterium]|nr:T9SS type A sorting domain-containing protein [Bacteroidia bacterium]
MKKHLLLSAIFTLGHCILLGQYFSNNYYLPWSGNPTVRFETFYDGMYTRLNYGGGNPLNHYLIGLGTNHFLTATPCPRPDSVITYLRFTRTSKNGNVIDANTAIAFREKNDTSILYNAAGYGIAEIDATNNKGGYATVGNVISFECDSMDRTDGLFLKLNNAGTASNCFRYDFIGGAEVFTKIIRSQLYSNTYYICGYTTIPSGNGIQAIVLSVNNKGAVNWSRTIDLSPTALGTQSKLFSLAEDLNNGNLFAVGTYYDPTVLSPNTQGLAISISSAGVVNWNKSYNLLHDEFRDVQYDTNSFIITGTSDFNPVPLGFNFNDIWLIKIDTTGTINFSNKLRISDNNGNEYQSRGVDMTVRLSSSNVKEYYITGPAYSNPSKAVVYKCNATGAGLNWYDYHETVYDYGFAIDKSPENATATKGFALFSNITEAPANLGAPHANLRRMYFNGVTCLRTCVPNIPNTIAVMPTVTTLTHTQQTQYTKRPLTAFNFTGATHNNCHVNSISCGSNAKTTDYFETDEFTVYPNPASDIINLSGINHYTISITDITGKQVMQVIQNDYETSIDISSLKPGIYFIDCGFNHALFVKR